MQVQIWEQNNEGNISLKKDAYYKCMQWNCMNFQFFCSGKIANFVTEPRNRWICCSKIKQVWFWATVTSNKMLAFYHRQ
jgi:hypothetical protein